MEKIVDWAKKLYKRKNFWSKIFCLAYEICVNAYFQGAIHLIASCVLGAFAYKDQALNWLFLIPFGIIYLILIFVFALCNVNRKNRNRLLEQYEFSYSQISESFLAEYRKNLELYDLGSGSSLEDLLKKYKEADFLTEACFRICDVINNVLQKDTDNKFRVTTFLRTNIDQDEYRIIGFSPLSAEPEMYGTTFVLENYKSLKKKKIPAHAQPFLNNRCEPLILIGSKKVSKAYQNFNEEQPTQLHIGIPIAINGMITMVIQITSHDEYTGTEGNIRDLIENVLSIFISYLKVIYMHQMKHEQLSLAKNK